MVREIREIPKGGTTEERRAFGAALRQIVATLKVNDADFALDAGYSPASFSRHKTGRDSIPHRERRAGYARAAGLSSVDEFDAIWQTGKPYTPKGYTPPPVPATPLRITPSATRMINLKLPANVVSALKELVVAVDESAGLGALLSSYAPPQTGR